MNLLIPIGRVVGPGEETGEIKIQTKDNLHSRVGEYLIYKTSLNDQVKDVFATITFRRIHRTLPASFLADPSIDALDVAAALGIDEADQGVEYELTAKILGYFDEQLQSFINPRINPNPNTTIFLAPDELLKPALFSQNVGETGSGRIGQLLLRPNLDVLVDINEMVSTHLAILAGTGSGKSYLARVLLEELMQPYNRGAIAVFDPHGEYESLASLSSQEEFQAKGYRPEVKVLSPGESLIIPIFDLSWGDIRFLLKDVSEKMSHYLETIHDQAFKKAKKQRRQWTYSDLMIELENLIEESETEGSGARATLEALKWRLEKRFNPKGNRPKIFVDNGGTLLNDLFKPGQCTIIKLDGVEEEEQQIIAAILLRKAYEAREKAVRDEEANSQNSINYPIFALMEEAHRFAPHGDGQGASTKILKTILSEGRKFGVGVGLITQRPGKLDQNVLSQCMTQFLMRIINPNDQDSVAKGVESAGRDLLKELPALSKGQAIVTGVSVRTPVLFKVRKAITKHKGASANSAEEWLKYFAPEEQAKRELQSATLSNSQVEKDPWEML
ncbi:MAG: ATP-binding protein [Candidatus Caenarcaniphilales bacterium]|nr:ATP-binding protein [Candidatus Caenarcaniphilales bacterium]